MSLSMMEHDVVTGFSLLKDSNDPPRFYVQRRNRRELIAIGDEMLARSRFAAWKERQVGAESRPSRWGFMNMPAAAAPESQPRVGDEAELAA